MLPDERAVPAPRQVPDAEEHGHVGVGPLHHLLEGLREAGHFLKVSDSTCTVAQ